MKSPRVSVIIPTYNNTRYIKQTVDSILNQTYDSYEIIVIDDGSTDTTRQTLKPFQDRLRYIYQNNQGVSAARNHGLSLARGEYIVFLDGDDILLPTKLTEQTALLDSHPKTGGVHSGWHIINQQGEITATIEPWQHALRLDLKAWLLWKPVFLGAMIFRREWLERVGGFDITLKQAEDVDLVCRLALKGCRFSWLYKSTVCYRQHGENTIRNGLQQAQGLMQMIDKFFAQPQLPFRIRGLECRVRYYTLMWLVWQLYRTGYTDEIAAYLCQSRKYVKYSAELTVEHWFGQLAHHCLEENLDINCLRGFLPYFKVAMYLDTLQWQNIEQRFAWWLEVWWYYLHNQYEQALHGLQTYQHLSVQQLVQLAQFGEILSPIPPTTEEIDLFWQDIKKSKSIPIVGDYEVTALYLTVFGQAVLARRWQVVFKAFKRIVQYGFHPKAFGAWWRFIRSAFIYFKGHPEGF